MQLRKMMLMLTALGAMSGFMAGCGDDGGEGPATCTSNDQCDTATEICHPTAGVCVQTCDSGDECPDSAKTCASLGGTGPNAATKICQCSTDVLCNGGPDSETSDLVCSDLDNVCVTKCASDGECGEGRVCDETSGQCEEGEEPQPTTCSGTGKSTCAYGDFCSNNACVDAPVAPTSCQNFPANDRPSWNPATNNGPVIYSVTRLRTESRSSLCQQGSTGADAFIVSVRAYRTDADWPATRSGLSGFFYVNTGTQEFDVVGQNLLIPNTGYNRNTANPRDAEFQVYLCRSPAGESQIQVGFYFTGGNPVCQDINR